MTGNATAGRPGRVGRKTSSGDEKFDVLKAKTATSQKRLRNGGIMLACVMITLSASTLVNGPTSGADQGDVDYPVEPLTQDAAGANASERVVIHPLPVITPTPLNWAPTVPYPYDRVRANVTDADITAEREMCQWYNAQYDELIRQIDSLQFNRITPNGPGVINGIGSDWDYSVGDLQQQADIVTSNIEQSVEFLAPRVQALTQNQDYVGDVYFPLDQGKSFYLLWQHLANVSAGIKSHQPDWFTGPSLQRVKRNGSVINRSHVCRY
jgi:hypothetical protein